jgi:hypothetical protein
MHKEPLHKVRVPKALLLRVHLLRVHLLRVHLLRVHLPRVHLPKVHLHKVLLLRVLMLMEPMLQGRVPKAHRLPHPPALRPLHSPLLLPGLIDSPPLSVSARIRTCIRPDRFLLQMKKAVALKATAFFTKRYSSIVECHHPCKILHKACFLLTFFMRNCIMPSRNYWSFPHLFIILGMEND